MRTQCNKEYESMRICIMNADTCVERRGVWTRNTVSVARSRGIWRGSARRSSFSWCASRSAPSTRSALSTHTRSSPSSTTNRFTPLLTPLQTDSLRIDDRGWWVEVQADISILIYSSIHIYVFGFSILSFFMRMHCFLHHLSFGDFFFHSFTLILIGINYYHKIMHPFSLHFDTDIRRKFQCKIANRISNLFFLLCFILREFMRIFPPFCFICCDKWVERFRALRRIMSSNQKFFLRNFWKGFWINQNYLYKIPFFAFK